MKGRLVVAASLVWVLGGCPRDPVQENDGGDGRLQQPDVARADRPRPRLDFTAPTSDRPEDQPPLSTTWSCGSAPDGRLLCARSAGLPPGGTAWRCHQAAVAAVSAWYCHGSASTDPSGDGWTCTLEATLGLWKCVRPDGVEDIPPGGDWVCWKSSQAGGTRCEKKQPPGSKACYPGQRMWCDGTVYGGWGQVDCDPITHTWKTTSGSSGGAVLDCGELGGDRPDTACACYHHYFNPACCERADCVVIDGSKGQICPASQGTLCSYCNAQKSECQETQAQCVVTNAHETFCGRLCSPAAPCPTGYQCLAVKLAGGQTTQQCIPSDYSCYF